MLKRKATSHFKECYKKPVPERASPIASTKKTTPRIKTNNLVSSYEDQNLYYKKLVPERASSIASTKKTTPRIKN
jgi:hypothetical protein